MKIFFKILLIVVFLMPLQAWGLDVVPGLKVFGGATRAAYGNSTNPTIYIVNTLNPTTAVANSTRNGVSVKTGGLDAILETAGDNKLIIFEVSGVIDGGSVSPVYVQENYITIAGQTAPSPGIILKNYMMIFSGHDILIQHIRTRMTDAKEGTPYEQRGAINITEYPGGTAAYNAVVDHCSFSWSMDENVGIGGTTNKSNNISISNCIIAEGLNNNRHSTPNHAMGLISPGGTNIGIFNNFFISHYARNPYFTSNGNHATDALIANNFIFNCKAVGTQFETRTTVDNFNIIGNVTEGGDDSGTYGSDRVVGLMRDQNDATDIYIYDNKCDNSTGTETQDDASDWNTSFTFVREITGGTVETTCKSLSATFSNPSGWTPLASSAVKTSVLANAGARPADRDAVDTRLVSEGNAGTGTVIDTVLYTSADCTASGIPFGCCTGSGTGTCVQAENGFPSLTENSDTHNDLPASPHDDDDNDGYTNLEEWLHVLATEVERLNTRNPLQPPADLEIKMQ